MEKNGKTERRIELCEKNYLSSETYAEYLWRRLKSGGVLIFFMRLYKKIRKYTLITAIIRGMAFVIGLLEKSAILLLIFSAFLLLLPIALIPLTVAMAVSVFLYFRLNGAVKPWISQAESVTVYITSERFFDGVTKEKRCFYEIRKNACDGTLSDERQGSEAPLFVRCAFSEAEEYTHPVIVVCSDPFLVARWAGFNLLAVKCDYFFILRRFYFNKKRVSYLVLS